MSFQDEFISFLHARDIDFQESTCGIEISEKGITFQLHEIDPYKLKEVKCPETDHKVHVWEDLWRHKRPVMESRIMSLLGRTKRIHARETKVIKLIKPQLRKFLEENHLSVPVTGKHKYGLVYRNELVAVALFSASCPVHRSDEVYNSHELIRFCNKNNITVVGGLSKLIEHFIKEHNPDDIMSYADLDWSKGKSYTRLGFKKIGELPPQTFYVDPGTLNRFYKINAPEAKLHLLAFKNQGSTKYLLDLKKKVNA
ncbi:MAG: hypothetical protein KDC79_07710 [Cyclobacteriaceae bacterium]|nr:hypothetical protein [Cyclobacteriaceae bacterium]